MTFDSDIMYYIMEKIDIVTACHGRWPRQSNLVLMNKSINHICAANVISDDINRLWMLL